MLFKVFMTLKANMGDLPDSFHGIERQRKTLEVEGFFEKCRAYIETSQ